MRAVRGVNRVFGFSAMLFSWLVYAGDSLPEQVFPFYETPALPDAMPWTLQELRQRLTLDEARVLVFPHWGSYAIPQGKERVADVVTLTSAGSCRGSWGITLAPFRKTLRAEELLGSLWIQCTEPVTLEREQGLKSFSYRGRLVIDAVSTEEGRILNIVNILPLEEYLRGVVAAEMPSHWNMEALKVQAIAARTYALYEIYQARKGSWMPRRYDIDDTVLYQAYLGASGESQKTDAAIASTSRQVATYHGKIIKAYFSADSGGYTEAAEVVWGKALPYCQAQPELYDPELVASAWRVTYTREELFRLLVERAAFDPQDSLEEVWVPLEDRTQSGRAGQVHVRLTSGKTVVLHGELFRHAARLRSMLYDVRTLSSGKMLFEGRGWGHGVGMSQYGTRALVEVLHWNAEQVLKFYYRGIELEHF